MDCKLFIHRLPFDLESFLNHFLLFYKKHIVAGFFCRVNVMNIAKQQGITLTECQTEIADGYQSLLKITAHGIDKNISLTGTLLGDQQPRLVAITDFEIEVIPEGVLLITRHEDRPGVIAAISSILGAANINITRMQVSKADQQQLAMMIISVSDPLNEELLQQVCALSAVHSARQIVL